MDDHCEPDEVMAIVAARSLVDGAVCFVGIGFPSEAANLARRLHAPNLMLVYESGTIGAKPEVLPLSIGDGELAETADVVVSLPEVFSYWLQGGRIDVGFLGAAQIDRVGSLNTTVIGAYDAPRVRLPGAGGAPEIARSAREVFVVAQHRPQTFVERLDFVTTSSAGNDDPRTSAARRTCYGITRVITDLGVLEPDAETRELVLTGIYPGTSEETVKARTGWPLKIRHDLEVIPNPTRRELGTLRELRERTNRMHEANAWLKQL